MQSGQEVFVLLSQHLVLNLHKGFLLGDVLAVQCLDNLQELLELLLPDAALHNLEKLPPIDDWLTLGGF